jgi:hypothetical protein
MSIDVDVRSLTTICGREAGELYRATLMDIHQDERFF